MLVDPRDKLSIPWQHSEEKQGCFDGLEDKAGLPVEPATVTEVSVGLPGRALSSDSLHICSSL